MKKYLLNIATLMMGAMMFTACSDDNDDVILPDYVNASNGVYVVCSGNKSSAIDGSLTYYDYSTKESKLSVFKSVNGRSLGITANDMIVYGSKAYIAVDGENSIEVVDAKTMKSIKRLSTTTMLGNEKGVGPRQLTGNNGLVYFSTYGRTVAALDTTDFNLQKTYSVGSYPEGIAVSNGFLYTANSDYGNQKYVSITKTNLSTGQTDSIKHEAITNPQKIEVVGSDIYFLDYGHYDASYNQLDAGVRKISADGTVTRLFAATGMARNGSKIYYFNNAYGSSSTNYGVYDIAAGTDKALNLQGIESPAAIGIDPINNYLIIASRKLVGGYPSYKTNGYLNQYDKNGNLVNHGIECGVGPTSIAFNLSYKK